MPLRLSCRSSRCPSSHRWSEQLDCIQLGHSCSGCPVNCQAISATLPGRGFNFSVLSTIVSEIMSPVVLQRPGSARVERCPVILATARQCCICGFGIGCEAGRPHYPLAVRLGPRELLKVRLTATRLHELRYPTPTPSTDRQRRFKHDATQAEYERFSGVGIAVAGPSNP